MNFVVICLHCLDMRDFHSHLRETPFLDGLRNESIFIPMGRAQGHHQRDSLNAELTGLWTARYCDSRLGPEGYLMARNFWYPKTLFEYLREAGYDIFTCLSVQEKDGPVPRTGTVAAGMQNTWLKNEPERMWQFNHPAGIGVEGILQEIQRSKKFYAHIFFRYTHRPWDQMEELCALIGHPPAKGWPDDAYVARRAALECPDEFAALRRRGLARADKAVESIYSTIKDRSDVTFIVYSNHGEVFDHFRYHMSYKTVGYVPGNTGMVVGVSHGPYPYEVLYANMQMWKIPGVAPKVMSGIGRSIDFTPTVLDIAGVGHSRLDGESMIPYYENGCMFPPRDRYAESGHAISMVRKDGYKFISTGAKSGLDRIDIHQRAIFDIQSDPNEFVNLAGTPQGNEVLSWAIETHTQMIKLPQPVPHG